MIDSSLVISGQRNTSWWLVDAISDLIHRYHWLMLCYYYRLVSQERNKSWWMVDAISVFIHRYHWLMLLLSTHYLSKCPLPRPRAVTCTRDWSSVAPMPPNHRTARPRSPPCRRRSRPPGSRGSCRARLRGGGATEMISQKGREYKTKIKVE